MLLHPVHAMALLQWFRGTLRQSLRWLLLRLCETCRRSTCGSCVWGNPGRSDMIQHDPSSFQVVNLCLRQPQISGVVDDIVEYGECLDQI